MSVSESERETESLNHLLSVIRKTLKSGWPDASNLGVPLKPQQDGWHWLLDGNKQPYLAQWDSDKNEWEGGLEPSCLMAYNTSYIGPCDLPHETAATLSSFLNKIDEGEHVVLDWEEATDAINDILIKKENADARALSRTYIPREDD